jgi:hypothetical protein
VGKVAGVGQELADVYLAEETIVIYRLAFEVIGGCGDQSDDCAPFWSYERSWISICRV